MTKKVSAEDRAALRQSMVGKLVELFNAGHDIDVSSTADNDGVRITISIPKGVPELMPHARDLAAIVASSQS